MTELELQQYLLREYPQENVRCEWKEFKNLKNSFCGDEKDDVISYVSAIANMEGGHLVISYTKTKGLHKEKLRQMILQYLKNAGDEGAKRDSIYEYIKDVLPQSKTQEQQLRMLGDILNAMKEDNLIKAKGRTWHER